MTADSWRSSRGHRGSARGGVLTPLLFNAFFAVILLVALEKFSEDADILAALPTYKNSRRMLVM